MTAIATLPTFEAQLEQIAAADQGDGWLACCVEAERYLLPNRQLVAALAECLRALDLEPGIEVCAGRGELVEALAGHDVHLRATDADPPAGSPVLAISAKEALKQYRPAVVLGCFVPIDSGVDEAVLAAGSVRHYVVLGARIGREFGSAALWRTPGWTCRSAARVSRWMLTRHDVWTATQPQPILQHGQAWCFSRESDANVSI